MHYKYSYSFILLILLVTIICYWQGLNGYFQYDDSLNISQNVYLRIKQLDFYSLWQAAMSGSAGVLKRPISMVSFALNYYFTGLNPYYFKLTNLIIHLLNGILVLMITLRLLQAYQTRINASLGEKNILIISLATTSAWLLHPINISAILYVVQRMASLSTLFMLLGILLYLVGRKRLDLGYQYGFIYIAIALMACTPLAMLCKENGVLLPVLLLIIESTILIWKTKTEQFKKALVAIFFIVVGLPAVILTGFLITHPNFVTLGYEIRDFNLPERLMTESRVLWFYLSLIFVPDISAYGFYHDDIAISRTLFDPQTTIASIFGLALLVYVGLRYRKQQPILSFGILFYFAAHALESSIFALGLTYEHRNYLPLYGALLPLMFYLLSANIEPNSFKLRASLAILFIILIAGVTKIRANHWGNALEMKMMEVQHHPKSVSALTDLGYFYMYVPATSSLEAQTNFNLAGSYFQKAIDLSNTDTAALFGIVRLHAQAGLKLDDSWWAELARRLKDVPLSPNSSNSIAALEKCYVEGVCKQSADQMEKLLVATLQNHTLSGKAKTLVLFAWSDFLFKSKKSPELAENAAFLAINASPKDIEQRLTLIIMLINMQKLDVAKTELHKLKLLDTKNVLMLKINEVESLLQINR